MSKKFSFGGRLRSFGYAFQGIAAFFRSQHNAWIHLVATIVVFAAAFYFHLSHTEFLLLVVVAGFVWVAEIFNTAIEEIMNHFSPNLHPKVKLIKDVAAGAVLIAAITAAISGIIIFYPKIF